MSRLYEALRRSQVDPTTRLLFEQSEPVARSEDPVACLPSWQSLRRISPAPKPDSRLVTLMDPTSLGAETFRSLAMKLAHRQKQCNLHRVLITSSGPEEGKTLVAANLAIALAMQPRQKVLLIEGDLRKPAMLKAFGVGVPLGLTEYIRQETTKISEVLYEFAKLPLVVLPCGAVPEDPLGILQSAKLADFMRQVVTSFSWVVIDSPPLVPLADANVWARMSDGILLVVREGRTSKRCLEQSVTLLDADRVIGLVVNEASHINHRYYDYYRHGYRTRVSRTKAWLQDLSTDLHKNYSARHRPSGPRVVQPAPENTKS